MISHSTESENRNHNTGVSFRALVIGSRMPGAIAAQALADTGVDVTFARLSTVQSSRCFAIPLHESGEVPDYSVNHERVRAVDMDQPPSVMLDHGGFQAQFEDGTTAAFDCLLLAPDVSLKPKPPGLPPDAELFSSRMASFSGQKVVFLMDYLDLSHPALGMAAIRLAMRNVQEGGASVVCFKHVPVAEAFGETLYDAARQEGVYFVRYGEQLPLVQRLPDESSPPFRIVVRDVIDIETEFIADCDRALVVTGPDLTSIPDWALKLVDRHSFDQGFLLPDTVHSASGASLASGVFVVGAAAGSLDWMNCVAQARSAAAQARGWIAGARSRCEKPPLEVGHACVRCLTCYRVCPHRAVSLQPQASHSRMDISALFCRDCGICVSVCPSGAFAPRPSAEASRPGVVDNVRAVGSPGKTVVFGCKRSAGNIAESISMPEQVDFIPVPCAGRVSEYSIWSALASGATGVLVVGCHQGNCASGFGSDLAHARVKRGQNLGILAGDSQKIGYLTAAANEPARFQRLLMDFVTARSH